jgi:hypothetical protein
MLCRNFANRTFVVGVQIQQESSRLSGQCSKRRYLSRGQKQLTVAAWQFGVQLFLVTVLSQFLRCRSKQAFVRFHISFDSTWPEPFSM